MKLAKSRHQKCSSAAEVDETPSAKQLQTLTFYNAGGLMPGEEARREVERDLGAKDVLAVQNQCNSGKEIETPCFNKASLLDPDSRVTSFDRPQSKLGDPCNQTACFSGGMVFDRIQEEEPTQATESLDTDTTSFQQMLGMNPSSGNLQAQVSPNAFTLPKFGSDTFFELSGSDRP